MAEPVLEFFVDLFEVCVRMPPNILTKGVHMGKTTTATEVWVTTKNEAGTLEKLTAPLAEAKVNVWGCTAWTEGTDAKFKFLTDNNDKALELWNGAGYTTTTAEVVTIELEDKPGTIWDTTQKLSTSGVDIKYCYVTTCGTCPTARLVLSTNDNAKTVSLLG